MSDLSMNGFGASRPVSGEIGRGEGYSETHVLNDNGGLSRFHHFEEEEEGHGRAKVMGGALVVALLLGGVGVYMYSTGAWSPGSASGPAKATVQMASNKPVPAPQPAAPPATADDSALANSPYAAAPEAAPVAKDMASAPSGQVDGSKSGEQEAKPVKTAKPVDKESKPDEAKLNAAAATETTQLNRDADNSTAQGSAPPATSSLDATATQSPTPPAPTASSMASNGSQEPSSGTAAQDVPAAPAEQAQPNTPAPQPDQPIQPPVQPQ